MNVICKPVGPVMANCYIVTDHGAALLIDPGDEAGMLCDMIDALDCRLEAILLTHAHFDHIGAVDDLVAKYHVPVYVNPNELDHLSSPDKNASSSFAGIPKISLQAKPEAFHEGLNTIGSFKVTAYFAPGHSVGSTILEIGDNLFTGDVLFQNSIGRTDLPGGSVEAMRDSIHFIKSIDRDYIVYPGHGPSTTLDYEKTHNPYLLYNLL